MLVKRSNTACLCYFKMYAANERKECKNSPKLKCLKFSQKAIYVFVLFVLTIVLLYQVWLCFEHYYKEPTYVETRIAPQHKAMFPAMTICPLNNGYKEEKLKVTSKLISFLQ